MALPLARRMIGFKAADVREMLKITQRGEVIPFAGGLPAPELLPVTELQQATCKVFDEQGPQALQYSTTEGCLPLREKIAQRMRSKYGIHRLASAVKEMMGA